MNRDPKSLPQLSTEAAKDNDRLAERPSPSRMSNEMMWRALAGNDLDLMLLSRESTEKFLQASSWKLRLAAISVLRSVWRARDELAKVCETIAYQDPHPQVRETALYTLAWCFNGTNDQRLGEILQRIVRDPTQPLSFRIAAYSGLFELRGSPIEAFPIPGKFRFPEDVQWSFVDSFGEEKSAMPK